MNSERRASVFLLRAAVAMSLPFVACSAASGADPAPEQTLSAGPIEATLTLDRSSLNVAESLRATLKVRAASGVRVSLPPVGTKLGGFTVVSASDEPLRTIATEKGEFQLLERRYTLEPFLPGEYKLPSLEIRWQRSANDSGVARTNEVKVEVLSLLPKDAGAGGKTLDPGTIRGEYSPPVANSRGTIWVGIAIGFGVALAAGGGLWLYGRRHRNPDRLTRLLEKVETLRRGLDASPPQADALHDLAGTLREALADRVDSRAASAEIGNLVERLEKAHAWVDSDAKRVGEVLGALDAARFGGKSMPASEFGRQVDSVAAILNMLRAMPSGGGR